MIEILEARKKYKHVFKLSFRTQVRIYFEIYLYVNNELKFKKFRVYLN